MTHSPQESPIRLGLSSVKKHLKKRLRGTEENKKFLSLFPARKAHYSSSSPLTEKHPPASPLNYLTFSVRASARHKAPLCLTPVLLLLRHRLHFLTGRFIFSSPPFLSPPLSSFSPVSLHCWLLTPSSSQPKSSSVPSTLTGLYTTTLPLKKN